MLFICNNIDELGSYYAKRNKSGSKRQIQYDVTYRWNQKKKKKLVNITKNRQVHSYREQTSGYQWREGVIWGWKSGRYKKKKKEWV